ncbi:MAG: glycosyltransferase 87 family protein [Spirosomataceae bacterium]
MQNRIFSLLTLLSKKPIWAVIGLSLTHFILARFGEREEIWRLWALVSLAFLFYIFLIREEKGFSQKFIFFSALALRIPFLGQEPLLSDDFYRFFWDGQLWISGYNAYEWLPSTFMATNQVLFSQELFNQLNSPNYYTVYPPLNQFIFSLSAYLSGNDVNQFVFVLQLILFGVEMSILWVILKLSTIKKKFRPELYYFNPLICLEFTGNIHFEGLLVSFLLLAYVIHTKYNKLWITSLLWGLSVATKLTPLIFAPLIWFHLTKKQRFSFFTLAFLFNALLFLPLFQISTFTHILSSINLYFQHFEFNASVYFVLRWFGNLLYGYNPIATLGPILSLFTFFGIWWISYRFRTRRIVEVALWIQLLFILLATTVHPWYLFPLILLSSVSSWRFPLIWSWLVFLTYFSYATVPYEENLYLVGLEYTLVIGFAWFEYTRMKRKVSTSA